MNKTYRLIWNISRNAWIIAAEIVSGKGGPPAVTRTVAAAALLTLSTATANALPTGGQVANGTVTMTTQGNTLTVTGTPSSIINWQGFSIAAGETARFNQQNAASAILNRVIGTDPSSILGTLQSNGRLFLINPNGIIFGQGSRIDTAGLIASSLNITDTDFMAGKYLFTGNSTAGAVKNQGEITTPAGGHVWLIAPNVENSGIITSPNGTVTLAAGQSVHVVDPDKPEIAVVVSAPTDQSVNLGSVIAQSGRIGMYGAIIAQKGIINANSAVMGEGGKIYFKATRKIELSDTSITTADGSTGGLIMARTEENGAIYGELVGRGLLSAQGDGSTGSGGFIETSAAKVDLNGGITVKTNGGNWLIDPVDFTIAATGGDMTGATLSTNLGSGAVTILSSAGGSGTAGNVNVNDSVTWSANALTLNAVGSVNINAPLYGSGSAQLVLQYGGSYVVNAPVNLPAGANFTANGVGYTVITSLGTAASSNDGTLQGMLGGLAGNYVLGSNIDATATSGWNVGAGFTPVGNITTSFSGTFDGLGHTISNLYIYNPSVDYAGLFGINGGTLRNVGLTGGSLLAINYVGPLAGQNNGIINNCYASSTVSGPNYAFGGLVGFNGVSGLITGSYATGSVTGGTYYQGWDFGGLVGVNNGIISKSYSTGLVSSGSLVQSAGGLVGSGSGQINNSYATGNVTTTTEGWRLGGLIGLNSGSITNSYATGSVTAITGTSQRLGGLVGQTTAGTISNSYATGTVNVSGGGTNVGGLIGQLTGGAVNSSYWNTTTSGQSISGGGTGLTTPQMKQMASFTGWNIARTGGSGTAWRIYEGNTYPMLASLLAPLTLVGASDATVTYNGAIQSGGTTSTGGVVGAAATGRTTGFYNGYYSNQQGYDITGGNLIINQLALTGSITAGTSTYGSALTPGTASFTNAVVGDTLGTATVLLNTTGLTSSSGNLRAGTHTGIQSVSALSGVDAGNYTFASVVGNYTVNQLALTGSITAGTSTYGSALTPGTASFTNAVAGDVPGTATVAVNTTGLTSSSGNLRAAAHTGIEYVTALSGADGANYSFASVVGNYTVNQLPLTGSSIAAVNTTYGTTTGTGAISFTNIQGIDVVGTTATINSPLYSSSGNLRAGSYTQTAGAISGADSGNYSFAGFTSAANYTVNQLALTGAIATGTSTYGSALTPGTASFSNAISGDTLGTATVSINTTGLTSSSGNLKAGTHTGIQSVSVLNGTDAANYTSASVVGDYTVNRLAITGTSISGATSIYGTSSPPPGTVSFANIIALDVAGSTAGIVNPQYDASGSMIVGNYLQRAGALSGADADNYNFSGFTTPVANYIINQLPLTGPTIVQGVNIAVIPPETLDPAAKPRSEDQEEMAKKEAQAKKDAEEQQNQKGEAGQEACN